MKQCSACKLSPDVIYADDQRTTVGVIVKGGYTRHQECACCFITRPTEREAIEAWDERQDNPSLFETDESPFKFKGVKSAPLKMSTLKGMFETSNRYLEPKKPT